MYSYEIEGSCPFKIRPKLLTLKNKANPREDFFSKILNRGNASNTCNTLKQKHKVLEVSNKADFHLK